MVRRSLAVICLIAMMSINLFGCGGSSQNQTSPNSTSTSIESAPAADYELLFIGNSHSSVNNLPGIVATLIETGTQKSANAFNAPGWGFLADRIGDGVTQATIEARSWTHVSLQAQKYSTTGRYSYPTDAAKTWIRSVKTVNATPIMFPEWPRRGNFEEGLRVHQLHVSIAQSEPACVAPIGLAWDLAISRFPQMVLHAPDGNHSALAGALLTAYVFYETITGEKADQLPYISSISVAEADQIRLKNIASETIEAHPPCQYFQAY